MKAKEMTISLRRILRALPRSGVRSWKRNLLILILLLAGAGLMLRQMNFSGDISRMLPRDSESLELYQAFSRSAMFNTTLLLFSVKEDGEDTTTPGVSEEVAAGKRKLMDEYTERIARRLTGHPLVLRVEHRFLPDDPPGKIRDLTRWIPQYRAAAVLPEERDRSSGKGKGKGGEGGEEETVPGGSAEALVHQLYRRLLVFSPGQTEEMLRSDPAGWNMRLLLPLEKFRKLSGIKLRPGSTGLVSEDGRHQMLLLETGVSATDSAGSRKWMNELEKELADCPEELEWGVIAGQRRAMENEEVLKRDVRTVGIASLVIFTLLTVLCYRCDLRSLLIPLIPLTASFLVLGAMPLLFRDCLFFVAGMGGVVVGLAVDYGIHIYSAMTETHPLRRLFRICAPLFTGALTSFAVFAVFLFSSTDGLRQLGFFAGCSLLLSMILMLLFLPPLLLGPGGREKKRKEKNLQYHGLRRIPPPDFPFRRPKTVLCIWGALLIPAAALLPELRFNTDVSQFDVASPELLKLEKQYQTLFQKEDIRPAFGLFRGKSKREVLEKLPAVPAQDTLQNADEDSPSSAPSENSFIEFFSPAELYPPESIREKNLLSWKNFYNSGAFDRWRGQTEKLAEEAGFHPGFLDPFFDSLREGILHPPQEPPELFQPLLERMVVKGTDGLWTAAILLDEKEALPAKKQLGAELVMSKQHFLEILSRDVSQEVFFPALAGVLSVVFITWIFFRNAGETLKALLVVFFTLCFTAAFFAAAGIAVNLSVLIAGIILSGLAVDYGIFMVNSLKRGGKDSAGVFHALYLSAATSAAGGLTVVFTTHPMLRDAGITLLCGIFFACLTAVFLLPALHALKKRKALPSSPPAQAPPLSAQSSPSQSPPETKVGDASLEENGRTHELDHEFGNENAETQNASAAHGTIPAKQASRRGALPLLLLLLLLASGTGSGCTTENFECNTLPILPSGDFPSGADFPEQKGKWLLESSVLLEYGFRKITALCLLSIDFERGILESAAVTPSGITLYDIAGNRDAIPGRWEMMPGQPWSEDPRRTASAILSDLAAIYCHDRFESLREGKRTERTLTLLSEEGTEYVFAGSPMRILRKKSAPGTENPWQVRYDRYIVSDHGLFPENPVLERPRAGYRISVKTHRIHRNGT